ncbi:4Fe-4S binding protein [uncultured Methanoregula sp.]|uniref:ATP-binding protein n=1 Tax=uncultured Methanoregula sp. TaxID=1005933 RepID=UPI002AAB0482|nr:4Fe-4S binding protein [uncultured Methanoregula sp.]
MKRKIISIDETKCNGCGQCIPDCPEGALQIIDGKARLVSDLFCDGLGACIGTCPEGAISVIERDAVPYDEYAVMETIIKQGTPVIRAHLEHLAGHGQSAFYNQAIEFLIERSIPVPDHMPPEQKVRSVASCNTQAGRMGEGVCHAGPHEPRPFAACPGSAARSIPRERGMGLRQPSGDMTTSELRQWPIQLALLNPQAPYFDNADLLISADCVPFSYANFHAEFLKGRILIMFCPKLDPDIEGYIDKLTTIFSSHTIRSITLLHMEVPCCSGVRYVVDKALAKAGITIPVDERTITIDGSVR